MVTVHKYCEGRKQLREIETGHIVLYVLWYFVRFFGTIHYRCYSNLTLLKTLRYQHTRRLL